LCLKDSNSLKTQLREIGRVDHHPHEDIHDSMKGLTFDYHFSGQRVGSVGQIELSIASILNDWDNNIYYRTCRYLGHHDGWKIKVRDHIFQHLTDLGVGIMLVRAIIDNFRVDKSKHREWVIHPD